MATLTFAKQSQCSGGGHVVIRASDGARSVDLHMHTDEIRGALGADDIESFFRVLLRYRSQGLSRAQINAALTAGISITI